MDDGLLERDRELAALERLVADAEQGRGHVALIEGPAGIGKTRLLAAARELAAGRMTVLAARCSELERDYSFGAVRQLLEAAAREASPERLLAGAAAPAAGVLGAPGADEPEGSFAVLHGLYWATLNLAEERPVLLALDDLQWSDAPSLRFVAYLARRLEGAPVLVAATVRTTDPGTDPGLLAEVAADPSTVAVRPGPLGEAAVAELVRERLGEGADPAFCSACLQATGGNPLLLLQLLSALQDDGVAPTAAGAAAVREIGPRAVSRTVLLRLSRLAGDAVAVARAVAVLGPSARVPEVAALAGLGEDAVARAVRELARADLLRAEAPLGFVHPLVRDAVYGDLLPGERELQHGRAAEVLVAAGAGEEEIAAQLVHAPRRGDGATVSLLRSAARDAWRRGAPDSAVTYLARALAEPPPEDARPGVLLELGTAEGEMDAPAAAEHLGEAYEQLADPRARATAAFPLTQSLMFTGRAAEGGALARRTLAELPAELADERQMIEAMGSFAVFFGDPERQALDVIARRREVREGDGPGARMAAAAAAFAWAVGGGPA
ncbi:MAG: AAA family ATPase, partial [Solirubrobacterales bacterium]|nr:AAA family ATPase [Solirubrobacterales bacterium]